MIWSGFIYSIPGWKTPAMAAALLAACGYELTHLPRPFQPYDPACHDLKQFFSYMLNQHKANRKVGILKIK